MKDYLNQFGMQLNENVELIRTGGLTKAMRSTLESLIILDSHAKTGKATNDLTWFDVWKMYSGLFKITFLQLL